MGDKMNNMGKMLNNPKQRNVYLMGAGAAVLTVVAGLWFASRPSGVAGPGGANVAPVGQVNTTPGASNSPRYNEMVVDANKANAEKAIEGNKSYIPVPVNTSSINTESPIDALDKQQKLQREQAERERIAREQEEAAKAPPPAPPVPTPVVETVAPPTVVQTQVAAPAKPKQKYSQDDYVLIATLSGAWKNKAPASEYNFAGEKQNNNASSGNGTGIQNASVGNEQVANPSNQKAPPFAKAGTIYNAILETGINSDEPSPVLAKIVSGDLKGTRLIGRMTTSGEKVIVEFNTASIPNMPSSLKLQAVAVDPGSSRTGLATDVDRHYFLRYGVLLASAFLGGYADAIARQNTTTTVTPEGGVVSTTGQLSSKDINRQAVGSVGKELANQTKTSIQNMKPTITVDAGSAVGILLMDDLYTKQ